MFHMAPGKFTKTICNSMLPTDVMLLINGQIAARWLILLTSPDITSTSKE
jgi:hypothetical protein